MERLTTQERMELEQVFAAIYTKRESKIIRFYREFYSISYIIKCKFKKFSKKIKNRQKHL